MSTVITFPMASLRLAARRRPKGYLDDVLANATVDGDQVSLTQEAYDRLREKYKNTQPAGPGTELKALLAKFGIHASPTCGCNAMARKMDAWGPDESLKHLEEIVDVMEETAKKRNLPFIRSAGRLLVRRAISKSRAMISKGGADEKRV